MTAFSDDSLNHASSSEAPHPASHTPAEQAPVSSAQMVLPTALSAAVPLWIFDIYERGGPTTEDWMRLQSLGRLLAERGDQLLFRGARAGETAEVFNALAEALAILSFLPGGVPFGEERFDALQVLSGLLGEERATSYLSQLRRKRAQ
jgi:hypothetical protein